MIGPFDDYHSLLVLESVAVAPPLVDQRAIDRETAAALTDAKLMKGRGQLLGEHLALRQRDGSRRLLRRSKLYSLATGDEMLAAVRAHIARIAKLGPGIVWFLLDPVHLVADSDDPRPRGAMRAGDPREYLLVRSIYGHEMQAVPE